MHDMWVMHPRNQICMYRIQRHCYCHLIISCFNKIQNGLLFWCRLTQVVHYHDHYQYSYFWSAMQQWQVYTSTMYQPCSKSASEKQPTRTKALRPVTRWQLRRLATADRHLTADVIMKSSGRRDSAMRDSTSSCWHSTVTMQTCNASSDDLQRQQTVNGKSGTLSVYLPPTVAIYMPWCRQVVSGNKTPTAKWH